MFEIYEFALKMQTVLYNSIFSILVTTVQLFGLKTVFASVSIPWPSLPVCPTPPSLNP